MAKKYTDIASSSIYNAVAGAQQHTAAHFPGVVEAAEGVSRWYPPRDVLIQAINMFITTAPDGDDCIININKNGAALFSGGDRPTIISGTDNSQKKELAIELNEGDYITIDIEQSGGSDLVVQVVYS